MSPEQQLLRLRLAGLLGEALADAVLYGRDGGPPAKVTTYDRGERRVSVYRLSEDGETLNIETTIYTRPEPLRQLDCTISFATPEAGR